MSDRCIIRANSSMSQNYPLKPFATVCTHRKTGFSLKANDLYQGVFVWSQSLLHLI